MNTRRLKKFLSLPVNSDETWQGGIVPMADVFGVPPAAAADDVALVLWRSAVSELVHAKPVSLASESRLSAFVEVMLEFSEEQEFPFRPTRIECNDRELADGLNNLLCDSGTTAVAAKMPKWHTVLAEMADHLRVTGPPIPSLRDSGCTDRQIEAFAHAAAAFYRAALWNHLDDVDLIQIENLEPPPHLKYAVVLGAASETYGLGFYDDAADHYNLMAQRTDPRQLSLFSLTFDKPDDVPPEDVAVWHELDLPLETGEAFPSMNFSSPKASRRPNPEELEFATVVLQALASTGEAEIDSGRWTKSVEILGKHQRCVLSIPNLLDPPDRGEWIRRGLMPERRGNERQLKLVQQFVEAHQGEMTLDELNAALIARFTGPMEDFELPMDTPVDRAEALCQQAIDAFGRRRIQLARQALAEDPTHVEANILLAESTRSAERRVTLFQNAVETGRTKLGAMLEEAAGHFWGIPETRPLMRACHGLAAALHESGQTNEAIEQYRHMLQLNPNDNQGVRYELIPLLLALHRDPEATELLDRYREPTALWHYMKSLVEFRVRGRSPISKKALHSAFRANKHVVAMLQSAEPPLFPDSYALGSPEEAAVCIRKLADAWDESEGYVEWMFRENSNWAEEQAKRFRDRRRNERKKIESQKRRRR
ncbi:MAG: tetratricopeptide repeat protein [Planctomycetaceae bacterium]